MVKLSPDTDIRKYLLSLSVERRAQAIALLSEEQIETMDRDWPFWLHIGQGEPSADWRTWVIKAGRGFGKTRAGSEWIRNLIKAGKALKIALVAATLEEARKVMVEGESGLLKVADYLIEDWFPSRGLLRFDNGSEARLFSGASPEILRGPEHHFAWCDELAKWEKPQETWDMLQFGMRLGEAPRVLVTTTPRPGPVLAGIMTAGRTVVTGGKTRANPHLPKAYVETVEELYAGTRLGRQELNGELLPDAAGALWTVEVLEKCRILDDGNSKISVRPGLVEELSCLAVKNQNSASTGSARTDLGEHNISPITRTIIGIDPPSGGGTCGIIACAVDADGIGHVLADHSVTARSPEGWAQAVVGAAKLHDASLIVAETNQGGEMVEATLRGAGCDVKVKPVTAKIGKSGRATPIAQRFEAGKVRLHGRFPELEAELCGLIAGGGYEGPGRSPDRADAMVWALTELMLGKARAEARIRGL